MVACGTECLRIRPVIQSLEQVPKHLEDPAFAASAAVALIPSGVILVVVVSARIAALHTRLGLLGVGGGKPFLKLAAV